MRRGGAWEQRRIADAARLLKWLLIQGASQGAEITRKEMATAMGWPVVRVDTIVRWLREHPEMGFAISMQHGVPWVVVSTPKDQIAGQAVSDEHGIATKNRLDLYWMLTRQLAVEFVHYSNIAAHARGSNEAKQATRRKNEHMKELVLIQGALKPQVAAEAELWVYIDEVINT